MTIEVNRLAAQVRRINQRVPFNFNFHTGGQLPGVDSREVVFWEDPRLDVGRIAMRIGSKVYIFTSASLTVVGDGEPGDPITSGLDHGGLTGLVPVGSDRNDDHTDLVNITPQTDARNVINPQGALDLGLRINGNFGLGTNPNVNHSGTTGGGSVLNGMWFDGTFVEKSITGDDSSSNLRISANVAHDGTQSGGQDDFGLVDTAKDGVTWALGSSAGGLVLYKESVVDGDGLPFPAFRYRTSGSLAKYYGNFMFGKADSGGEVPINSTHPIGGGGGQFSPRVEIHTADGNDSAHGLLLYSNITNAGSPPYDPIPLIIEVAGSATEFMVLHRSTGSVDTTMRITIPNVAPPASRSEIEYDGQTLELNVSGMSAYPSAVTEDHGVVVQQKQTFVDQDATPVAHRRLACVDGFIVATDTVDVEGGYISAGSVEAAFLRSDESDNYESGTLTFDSGTTLSLADNVKILLGDSANDGEIYYDGTDLVYDSGNSGVAVHRFKTAQIQLDIANIVFGAVPAESGTATFNTQATGIATYSFLRPDGVTSLDIILTDTTSKIDVGNDFEWISPADFTITASSGSIILNPSTAVQLNAPTVIGDLSLTINDGSAGDPTLAFDGATQDSTLAYDDSEDEFVFGSSLAPVTITGGTPLTLPGATVAITDTSIIEFGSGSLVTELILLGNGVFGAQFLVQESGGENLKLLQSSTGSSFTASKLLSFGATDGVISFSTNTGNILFAPAAALDILFNDAGNANVNIRMESENDANMFFLDGSVDMLGLRTASPVATLDVNGSLAFGLVTITNADSPYTVLSTDYTIICDCTDGAITVNLPAVASNLGRVLNIKKIDATGNAVTADGNGSETIDDALTAVISGRYDNLSPQAASAGWWLVH